MGESLPFLPGYSFRDVTKSRFVFPETLVHSKGAQISKPFSKGTVKEAIEFLTAQNKELDHDKLVELTYGPKRESKREVFLPRYLALDKKILRFFGYFREETDDWAGENYRIRPVKVMYYLANDTMEVVEPRVVNSGLVQGTYFKRQVFPHPKGKGRRYMWKDLNLGQDIHVFGITIRLTDCDQWTREYMINAGIELNDSEGIPPDPYTEQRRTAGPRHEYRPEIVEDRKLFKFLRLDRKVLRFYGTWQDVLSDPPEMRRVILQYYLADDEMELLEDHAPNSGRDNAKVVIRKQKVPVDRNELPESFPLTYQEIKDDDLRWFTPKDFRTGKDLLIFGKKIFLYDCDNFTRDYYKTHLGIEDMESIAVAEKPKLQQPRVIPPHDGMGEWDDSLQNCLSLVPKRVRRNLVKELRFDKVVLRFKAHMISPMPNDNLRRFVVSFFPGDDTVQINEESVPNTGFPGGLFFKKEKLLKKQAGSDVRPIYHLADDFYVGTQIRASGRIFELTDADPFVQTFMEEHPELYSEEHVKAHKDAISAIQNKGRPELNEDEIIERLREHVIKNYGTSPYPLPNALNLGCDMPKKEKVEHELYCANLPIPQTLINTVIDAYTDQNNRTDLQKLRKVFIPALGHKY